MAAARQNFDSDSSDINSFTGGSGSKLKGYPVQVVVATDEHNFELDENALEEVLLNPKIKDKHVVVVSVAGAFRKGKSFLLDFFLRYMQAQGSEDWLGNDCTPLQGFPWRGGADRDTTGILMWSEPFEVTLPSGDEVVVLLMDTQGAFDDQSTVKDCATVFALSTMISSVQVFNISSNIQEDDLQHLQLFTEYGRLALEDNGSKPFQALWFLVRDWSYPYQFDYGETGGIKLLEKRLQVGNRQHPELQQLRRHIHACFSQIDCFLMPHPGLKVATSPRFDGKLSDIEADFKEMLHSLVPLLLRNDKLVLKEIHGSKITAKDLVEYFKAYINVFKGDELPEPKSMLQATAEANNLSAVANAKEAYTREMEMVCGGDKPYLHPDQLAREHVRIRDYAIRQFAATKKMGGINFSEAYKEKLASEVEEQYENYAKHNASKNIFAAARTPAVLFGIMAICYLSSGVLGIVGLENLANLLNLLMGLAVVLLSVWAYIRYSGDHREIGGYIDAFAELVWENAMGPVLKKIAKGHSVPVAAAANLLDKKED